MWNLEILWKRKHQTLRGEAFNRRVLMKFYAFTKMVGSF